MLWSSLELILKFFGLSWLGTYFKIDLGRKILLSGEMFCCQYWYWLKTQWRSVIAKNRKIWKSLKSSLHTQIGLRLSIIIFWEKTISKKLNSQWKFCPEMKAKPNQEPLQQLDPKSKRLWVQFYSIDVAQSWQENLKKIFLLFRKMMEATTSPILAGKWV